MSEILLLNPPFTSHGYKTIGEYASRSFPVGLGALSGALKRGGFSFSVLDADALDLSMDKVFATIAQRKPRVIGMSTYTPYAHMMEMMVKEIKRLSKNSVVVLGGHHAFAKKGYLLDETLSDVIAIGEGETIFPALCDAALNGKDLDVVKGIYFRREGRILYTGDNAYMENLDDLPMPSYESFPMDRYRGHFYRRWTSGYRSPFGNIITSRGCPFNCGFCSNVMWGRRVRFQSPERVMREIDHLVKYHGIRQLSFFDDTFTIDMRRAGEICDLLIERDYGLDIYCSTRVDFLDEGLTRKMARSGFKWIGIGIESGNERILKKISKNQSVKRCSEALHTIAANRIAVFGSVILGYPEEDKSTLNDTLSFLLKNPVHLPQFNIFVPYPGTPIYSELVAKGLHIPMDMGQLSKVASYNKSISTRYLLFFQWYCYIRCLLNVRYLNLIKRTFKLRIVFFDLVKIAWALFRLDRIK